MSGKPLSRLHLALGAMLLCGQVGAESGPVIPCDSCSAQARFDAPRPGLWFNPDRPGRGMTLETQNGLLIGGVYAYDMEGNAQWYTFSGMLAQEQGADFTLSLTTQLDRYEGGTCLGCAFSEPTVVRDAGTITIAFNQRNYGWFSVDGGEREFIVPLLAGVASAQDFPTSEYAFPELTGTWTFAIDNPSVEGPWGGRSLLLNIGGKSVRLDSQQRPFVLEYEILLYSGTVDVTESGRVECHSELDANQERLAPECTLGLSADYPGLGSQLLEFPFPNADMGDDRMDLLHPETGIRIRAFRVTH